MNIFEYLQNPYIILSLITIICIVILLGYIDDKFNENNKKTNLGYFKLIILNLICCLSMLFILIHIIKTGKLTIKVNNFNFDLDKITGEPNF